MPALAEQQGHEALAAVDRVTLAIAVEAVTAFNYMLGFRRRRSNAATASGARATPPTAVERAGPHSL